MEPQPTITKTNRHAIIPVAVFLAAVLLVWVGITAIPAAERRPAPKLYNEAVFDLRTADFTDTIHFIDNRDDWDSWPERLYTPQDFENQTVSEPRNLVHADFSHYQFFTHRITLLLTPGMAYGISMPSAEYAMRLFVDGEQAALIGLPGTTREENIARTSNSVVHFFVPQYERVDVIIQSSNFVHQFGGEPRVVYIGSIQNIQRQQLIASMLIFLISGSLLTSALYHLALVLMNRKRKAELIFSVCCFLGFMMSTDPIPLLFLHYNWSVMFRVEYLVFYGTFGMIGYLFVTLMPHYAHKRLMRVYYAVCITLALTAVFLDTTVFTGFINFFYPVGITMLVYGLIRLGVVLKNGKVEDFLAFAGLLVIMIFTANDVLYHTRIPVLINMRGFLPAWGVHFTAPIGIVFFVFCYALLLALKYAETEKQAMEASIREEALATENAALDSLSRMKSVYMSNLSHETKTPLAVISGHVQQAREVFEQITNEGKNIDEDSEIVINSLIRAQEGLLRVSRIANNALWLTSTQESRGQMKPLDAGNLIANSAEAYRSIIERQGNALSIYAPANLPQILGESDQLVQVMSNLLTNANNHTKDGAITVSVERMANDIKVTVKDNGTGIPRSLLPHVFERGITGAVDTGGTGMGLPICQSIIGQFGGGIAIESQQDEGTTVTFTIPVYDESTNKGGER